MAASQQSLCNFLAANGCVGWVNGLATGSTFAFLLAVASLLVIGSPTCYNDATNHYQPFYGGSDMNSCVVSDSNK